MGKTDEKFFIWLHEYHFPAQWTSMQYLTVWHLTCQQHIHPLGFIFSLVVSSWSIVPLLYDNSIQTFVIYVPYVCIVKRSNSSRILSDILKIPLDLIISTHTSSLTLPFNLPFNPCCSNIPNSPFMSLYSMPPPLENSPSPKFLTSFLITVDIPDEAYMSKKSKLSHKRKERVCDISNLKIDKWKKCNA